MTTFRAPVARRSARTTVLAAALATVSTSVHADTIYWDGTGGSWNDVTAWSTSAVAPTPDPAAVPGVNDHVVFNTATGVGQVVSFSSSHQFALSLTFSGTDNVNIGSGGGNRDLTIGAGGVTLGSSAGSVTIGNSSGGSNVFARLGATQTWTNNSSSGLTSRNNTRPAADLATPITLTMVANGTGAITHSGALGDGDGGSVLSVIVDSPGSGAASLGSGTYSGGTTIKRGQLSGPSFGTSGVILGDAAGGDARLNLSAGTVTNTITVVAGAGVRSLTGSSTAAEGVTFAGPITLGDNLTIGSQSNQGRLVNVTGNISGSGAITASRVANGSSNPTVVITGNNSYTGGTSVPSATLVVSSLNSVVGGSATSSLGAPTTVQNGTIAMSGVSASTLRYIGTGETTDRVIDMAGATNSVTLEQAGTGHLRFTSNLSTTGNGNKTLILRGDTLGTAEFAGAIGNSTGTTAVSKQDSGTWTLSGANTYTGTTTVAAGTLLVNGSISGGSITVQAPGTLGGTGTLGANTSVAGTISPGTVIGALTVGNNLTLAGTYLWQFDNAGSLGSAGVNYDQIVLSGASATLAVGGTLQVALVSGDYSGSFWDSPRVWTIIDVANSAGTSGLFANIASQASPQRGVFGVQYASGDVQLTWTPVPEPAATSILAFASVGLLRRRRVASAD